nr:DUF2339 domain-containing protein [Schlegelella koreensis]
MPRAEAASALRDGTSDANGPADAAAALPASPALAAGAAAPEAGPAAPIRTAPRRDWLAPVRDWLFGGNTIVKAGVAILFIGLAFLAKYASENVRVPIELRLALIGGVAVALLVVGWRLRARRPAYAHVLQGGAIAVLYLTLFVAFKFYAVLAVAPVFALMVAVAVLAAALAVLQDARSLAVIGAIGGFAAPLLVSTGSGNHVALFSYYLVLDLGIAAVAWYRTWRVLNVVGFVGTFVVATAWGVLAYDPARYASSQAFLIAFFVLFLAILLMPARRLVGAVTAEAEGVAAAPRSDAWVNGSLLFGLPTIVFALQVGLVRHMEYGAAISALVLAAVYVGLASWMRRHPRLGLTFDASLAIGTVFLTLVIPFALDARSTAGAWSLEGAALVWLGLRQRRVLPRVFGYVLLLISGLAMLHGHDRYGAAERVLNAYLFNGLLAAAACLAAAHFVRRFADRVASRHGEASAEPLLIGLATLWLVATALTQIADLVPARLRLAALLASASAVALLYTALRVRLAWPLIGWPTLAHAPLMLLALAVGTVVVESPLARGGWWAWPLAALAHLGLLRLVVPAWPQVVRRAVHAAGAVALAGFGALQGRAWSAALDADLASAWPWLGWFVVPAALLLWLPRPGAARLWPVRAEPVAYARSAAGVIAGALLLWSLVGNVASDGSAPPLPYVPLLNPLDIGVGIALAAIALWLRSAASGLPAARALRVTVLLVGVATFVWLNAMLLRTFHHVGGVPYRLDAWVDSLAVQTGLTLLWAATALALMWTAARRALRPAWVAGAALLGVVVLKLLIVDLSGSGTVMRIVSFIGVGVLMLVIGYVAPLPSKGAADAAR